MSFGYNPERNAPRWDAIRPRLEARKPMSVADYGSNWGFFSLEAAAAFPEALVVSIEDGGMAHTDDPRWGKAGMLEHHRAEAARRGLGNNVVVPRHITEEWLSRLAEAGVRFDAQMVLSFLHWLDLPGPADFDRCIRTAVRLARTTILEMPKAEPHQHNGAQILRWYDGDPDPQRLLERALAGTGAEVERFALDVAYRPLFEIRTADAASTPEFIISVVGSDG